MRTQLIVPDLLAMAPKEMRRAWDKFMAHHDFRDSDMVAFVKAEWVRVSIEERIMQDAHEAEAVSQTQLQQRFVAFCEHWERPSVCA